MRAKRSDCRKDSVTASLGWTIGESLPKYGSIPMPYVLQTRPTLFAYKMILGGSSYTIRLFFPACARRLVNFLFYTPEELCYRSKYSKVTLQPPSAKN